MKIVDVCAFYTASGGGVRTYVDRKLAWAKTEGHELVVIAPGEADRVEERGEGSRICWIASPRFPLDFNYRFFDGAGALHAALDEERPDFVEASSPWRSASMVGSWRGDAPRALIMHADPLSAYAYRWFERVATRSTIDLGFRRYWDHLRLLDRQFDAVVSASPDLSDRLSQGGLRNVATNPMGVEPGIFSPGLRDTGLRERLLASCGLPANAVLLLAVGRHAPEKRWSMVIEAVMAAGFSTPVGLLLVGDGRIRSRIIRAIGDNPHIRMLAPIVDRRELARLMASADALVHGCEAETFCMVAAEAAASGLPLIVPDTGGASDHGRANGGVLYRAGSAPDLAKVIAGYVPQRKDRIAGFAKPVEPVRTMDDHFGRLVLRYSEIISQRRIAA